MNNLVQKSIRFPAQSVEIIERKVRSRLGIDFNEYLKNFVINKAEEFLNDESISDSLRKEVVQAKRDVKKGKKKLLKTPDDIDEYVDNILLQ